MPHLYELLLPYPFARNGISKVVERAHSRRLIRRTRDTFLAAAAAAAATVASSFCTLFLGLLLQLLRL